MSSYDYNNEDPSDDAYGYLAALVAAACYGSYGVPIKATLRVRTLHPLVVQSYKTFTMAVVSILVLGTCGPLLAPRNSAGAAHRSYWTFTRWGLLSGLLWVAGATFGIFAIRSAGMAPAIGTWASVMVAVNFVWGILIFGEPVASLLGAFLAFCLLGLGLVGMSVYSAPPKPAVVRDNDDSTGTSPPLAAQPYLDLTVVTSSSAVYTPGRPAAATVGLDSYQREEDGSASTGSSSSSIPDAEDGILLESRQRSAGAAAVDSAGCTVVVLGHAMTLRTAGLAAAVVNGILNGSAMIPLHYAKAEGYAGANYFLSFAVGALVANVGLWVLYFAWSAADEAAKGVGSMGTVLRRAYERLPDWHVRQLWFPGVSAGVLLSIAMFGSILAVTYLGQGVGNSVVQAKIFVSGLWGIFYYREITGQETITKWFLSAGLTVAAIVWLTYERLLADQ